MLGSSSQVLIRKARSADASALARVFRDSWSTAYRGIIPHGHLQGMIAKRSDAWWEGATRDGDSILVVEVSGIVAGYATFGPARGAGKARGEIYELYLAPVYQGLGLGELLFEAVRNALELQHLAGLVVWALADNEPAITFYWRRGGRPVAETLEHLGGARLPKIAFAWS
jgi:ribosomal protein S18 acetylase RimI-like enzyme